MINRDKLWYFDTTTSPSMIMNCHVPTPDNIVWYIETAHHLKFQNMFKFIKRDENSETKHHLKKKDNRKSFLRHGTFKSIWNSPTPPLDVCLKAKLTRVSISSLQESRTGDLWRMFFHYYSWHHRGQILRLPLGSCGWWRIDFLVRSREQALSTKY